MTNYCVNYWNNAQYLLNNLQKAAGERINCLPTPLQSAIQVIVSVASLPFIALGALSYDAKDKPVSFVAKAVAEPPITLRIWVDKPKNGIEYEVDKGNSYLKLHLYRQQWGQLTIHDLPNHLSGLFTEIPSNPVYFFDNFRKPGGPALWYLRVPPNKNLRFFTLPLNHYGFHVLSTPFYLLNDAGHLTPLYFKPFRTSPVTNTLPLYQVQPMEPDGSPSPLIIKTSWPEPIQLLSDTPIVNQSEETVRLHINGEEIKLEPGQIWKNGAPLIQVVTKSGTYLVHKELADHCPMFTTMEQARDGSYVMTDLPAKSVEKALTFLYRGMTHITLEDLADAIECGHKLNYDKFLNFCTATAVAQECELLKHPKDFTKFITIAHNYNLVALKGCLMIYQLARLIYQYVPPECVLEQFKRLKAHNIGKTIDENLYTYIRTTPFEEDKTLIYHSINPYWTNHDERMIQPPLWDREKTSDKNNVVIRDGDEGNAIFEAWSKAYAKTEEYLDCFDSDPIYREMMTLMRLGSPINPFTLKMIKK